MTVSDPRHAAREKRLQADHLAALAREAHPRDQLATAEEMTADARALLAAAGVEPVEPEGGTEAMLLAQALELRQQAAQLDREGALLAQREGRP